MTFALAVAFSQRAKLLMCLSRRMFDLRLTQSRTYSCMYMQPQSALEPAQCQLADLGSEGYVLQMPCLPEPEPCGAAPKNPQSLKGQPLPLPQCGTVMQVTQLQHLGVLAILDRIIVTVWRLFLH